MNPLFDLYAHCSESAAKALHDRRNHLDQYLDDDIASTHEQCFSTLNGAGTSGEGSKAVNAG